MRIEFTFEDITEENGLPGRLVLLNGQDRGCIFMDTRTWHFYPSGATDGLNGKELAELARAMIALPPVFTDLWPKP